MAIINAVKTGNISDPTVLDGTPQSGDTIRCGNYIVTVDIDFDIGTGTLERNGSGQFRVTSAPRTITANIASVSGAWGAALECSHTSGTVTINGNVTGGPNAGAYGIMSASSGALMLNGNASGGTGDTAYGAYITGTGDVTIYAAIGSASSNGHGVRVTGACSIDITQAIAGGKNADGVSVYAAATVTVGSSLGASGFGSGVYVAADGAAVDVGTAIGGSGLNGKGVTVAANATVYVTNATGGAGAGAHGVYVKSNSTVTIGDATGGADGTAYGLYVSVGCTAIVQTATGGSLGHGVYAAANGCTVYDAYPNAFGNGSVTTYAAGVGSAHNAYVKVRRAHCNQYGTWPIMGRAYVDEAIYPNYTVQVYDKDGQSHTMIEPNGSADYPAESDVRYGTQYDYGDFVGSCHVPIAAHVAYGIAVDHTVGSAVLLPDTIAEAVWDEARSGHTTDGTFGDVAEWAGGSPPTVNEIADGVWDEPRADHTTTGTFGDVAEWAGSGGGGDPSAIADAVWDEPRSEHTTTGTFGDVATWAAGYGPLRLTVHVNDGVADLSGASVIVAVGSGLTARYVQMTDPEGRASFFVPYGLTSVTVWKSGYLSYSTSVIMDADRLMEVQLQQLVIPSSGDPEQTSAWLYTYDGGGNVAEGAVITFVLAAPPDGTGSSYATDEFTATSDENGLLTVNLRCGATYIAKRGNGRWVSFTTGTDPTFALPQVLGRDSA